MNLSERLATVDRQAWRHRVTAGLPLAIALCWALAVMLWEPQAARAQPLDNPKFGNRPDPFYPIDFWFASPNDQRLGSGAPGPEYWQQRADYVIDVTLDDDKQTITGKETVTYFNQSPHPLAYLWFQLDQNRYRPDSESAMTATAPGLDGRVPFGVVRSLLARESFPGGCQIASITGPGDKPLDFTVVGTVMRVDLPKMLMPGEKVQLKIAFSHNITDAKVIRGRGGYEYFPEDGNRIYEIAQWFPRLAAYTDYAGWRHDQYVALGEFTLEFGDYVVRITVPDDHIVAASGELKNPDAVLTPAQRERLAQAAKAKEPMFIVTPEEAKAAQSKKPADRLGTTKTWEFHAKDVRDFAFATSRKFIWDAVGHPVQGRTVMAMSYYPNEAEPLWSKYSTASVAHTLNVYGKYTFDYPYPVAISVNGPIYGMEYPMICFNGPRPDPDGTYSDSTKYGLISVVIHEVGHNWFPMIVNSDERRWTWMDEGLNTFLQYLAEQEWEDDYPSRRGEPADIVGYMVSPDQRPIMTESESLLQFGNNAYAKPATALNILRETVLGRELFDFAFKEFANRWRFKRPMPEDFFRTMEDASGQSLDWFWHGWFFSTDHVDIALDRLRLYQIDSGDPDESSNRKRQQRDQREPSLSKERNQSLPKRVDLLPGLKDFYNDYDEFEVSDDDRKAFDKFVEGLDPDDRELLRKKTNFYVLSFRNVGGLVSPIILDVVYEDDSKQRITIPASIWRVDPLAVDKLIISDKLIRRIAIDPQRQTADSDDANNHWPPKLVPSRFQLFKESKSSNPMRKARETAEKQRQAQEKKAADEAKSKSDADKTDPKANGDKADAAKSDQAKGDDLKKDGTKPAEPMKDDDKKDDAKKDDAKKDDAKKDDAKKDDAKKDDAKKDDAKKDDPKPQNLKAKPSDDQKPEPSITDPPRTKPNGKPMKPKVKKKGQKKGPREDRQPKPSDPVRTPI